jgi:hypothetical protein
MVNMITTGHQWRHQAQEVLDMKHQAVEERARPTGKMDGTLDLPSNIIDVTQCTSIKLEFSSTKDLAVEASRQITHALLHQQPAGPFTQVGNDNMFTLEQLAVIFKGAFLRHRRSLTTPPAKIDDSDTPPRVQITVSPPKVQNAATPPRVVLPTKTNITVPNSDCHLQPTPRRVVTLYTPHPMARRSAPSHNLSDDMLAETVQQHPQHKYP